jgi:3-oxoadipate enol-lactonase/4-carboxymuconolactone decarboxylase
MAEALTLPPELMLRRFVENALSPSAPAGLADELFAYRQAHPPDPAGWASQAAAGAAWDAGDRLGRITAPTLVVTGTDDRVVAPSNSPLLAERIAGAQLVEIEGAGHMLFWEKPEEFAAVVEGFLG